MNRTEDNSTNTFRSLHKVAVELLEVHAAEPGVRTLVIGGDGGVVEQCNGANLRKLGFDSNDGAPVEGLDVCAGVHVVFFEERDEVGDVGLDWKGFVGGKGVDFSLGVLAGRRGEERGKGPRG